MLTQNVRLVDLRDGGLFRLAIARAALVATSPQHYPCTRIWADACQRLTVGGQSVDGC